MTSIVKRSRWDNDSDDDDDDDDNKESKKKSSQSEFYLKKKKKSKTSSTTTTNTTTEGTVANTTQGIVEKSTTTTTSTTLSHPTASAAEVVVPWKTSCRSVECYERLNFIDQGTYGMVFRARCRDTNTIYALKQVKLHPDSNRNGFPITAFREINILLTLNHPNILNVREMVIGSTMDKIYMVMEYYENDLKAVMKMSRQSFSMAEIKRLMIQLLDALAYLHKRWYLHRDLKSSNLLYSNKGQLCICDFGLARKYESSPSHPYTFEVVTLWYRAPELLLGIRNYGPAIDLWSAGCIMAEMISGEPLFPGQGPIDQIQRIFSILGAPNELLWPDFKVLVAPEQQRKLSWKLPNRSRLREVFPVAAFAGNLALSDTGIQLLSQLLHMDPKQRLTASEALQHCWLTQELPRATPEDLMPVFHASNEKA